MVTGKRDMGNVVQGMATTILQLNKCFWPAVAKMPKDLKWFYDARVYYKVTGDRTKRTAGK